MRSFIITLFSLLFFSSTIFSQFEVQPYSLTQKVSRDIWVARNEQMRVDILRDIDSLKPKDQARFLADLGNIYWSQDKKYADSLLTRSSEIALGPAAEYKDNLEKTRALNYLLFFGQAFENDQILSKKLLSKISEIVIDEVKNNGSDDYSETLIFLAEQLIQKDEKAAIDFALLSLKGKKPVLDYSSLMFFVKLKRKNEELSNLYFAKMLELVRTNNGQDQMQNLISIAREYMIHDHKPTLITDFQRRELLSDLIPFIQKESTDFFKKNETDCKLTADYGKRFLEDYRKFLPQKVGIVEKALNICKIKTIPDSDNKKSKSGQYFFDLAGKTTDQKIKTNYLFIASSLAESENDNKLAVISLDNIDIESRKQAGSLWDEFRIQRGSKLIRDIVGRNNITEVVTEIDKSPQNLRPYILMDAAKELRYNIQYKQFTLDMLNQAKTELNKMNYLQPTAVVPFNQANPARFESMVNTYFWLGDQNEALNTFERFIDIQNQLSSHFTYTAKNGEVYTYHFYDSIPREFLDANFERIYRNTERIESVKIRLTMKLNILRNNLLVNGSFGSTGMIQIS